MSTPVTPTPERVDERRWWTLAVLCLSLVMVVAGNSSLNVALPTLVRELHASQSQLQWIVDAYSLVFGGLLLFAGALGDRYGRKGMLQLGLTIFGLAALVSTRATSPSHLIATRAGMGVGAALVMPATLSILANVFPPHERPRAIAVWAGFAGAGAAIGPVTSGFLLDHFYWGSIFFVNTPIVVLALVSGAVLVPRSKDPEERKLDPFGGLLSIIGLGALLYAIIEAPDLGWGHSSVVMSFTVAVVVLAGFVWWERRAPEPMLQLGWFRDRRFTISSLTISTVFFALFGMFFVMTEYLQFVKAWSPLQAGAAGLPMAAMMVIAAPRSAAMSQRFGPRRVMTAGFLVLAAGMLLFARVGPDTPYLEFLPAIILLGLGMGTTTPPATTGIMASLPLGKAGVGSAVNDTSREVGGALGIAVLGSVLSSVYRSSLQAHLVGLPPDLARAARDNVGAALGVAARLPGAVGGPLAHAARAAFTDALSVTLVGSAAAAVIGAVIVGRLYPGVEPTLEEVNPDEAVVAGGPGVPGPAPVLDL